MSDKNYVCPQCGPDPAGPEAHQQSHHMIPSFDDSAELAALRALADTLRERAHAFANERDALRARVAEADRLLREWHHYYHNPASTDAEGTDDDTSTWLAGLPGNKSPGNEGESRNG